MPLQMRDFENVPWKASGSKRPFWHFGGMQYDINSAVGQEGHNHLPLDMDVRCLGLVLSFQTTPALPCFCYTAPVSITSSPTSPPGEFPVLHQSAAHPSPFMPAFLDLPVQSDQALSTNVLAWKFHQLKNCVLGHGLLSGAYRSLGRAGLQKA